MVNEKAELYAKQGELVMAGPIGKFPCFGDYVLDSKGARVYAVPEGIEILSYSPITGEMSWESIKNFTVEDDCPTVELKLSWGRKIIVSSNESVAVFNDKDGMITKAFPSELSGKFIPAFKKNPFRFGEYGNAELGWIHGMFISDGWVSRNIVGLCKLEDAKRDRFIEYVKRNITQDMTIHTYREDACNNKNKLGESAKIHLSSEALAIHFKELSLYNWSEQASEDGTKERSSNHKKVGDMMIKEGSEEYLWGLLSGLLDGDGTITANTSTKNTRYGVRYSTSSPFLRDSICALLYRLGVRYTVTTAPARGWSKEAYTINPSSCDIQANLSKLTCIGEREQLILADWSKQALSHDSRDPIPMTKIEVDIWKKIMYAKKDMTAYGSAKGGYVNRPMLQVKFAAMTEDERKLLKALERRVNSDNVIWLKSEEVVDAGKRTVYDFEVANTKLFVVNEGIVVYDTMQLHVPVSQQAVKRVIENMLPSKNLRSVASGKTQFRPLGEFAQGLYLASRPGTGKPVRFKTREDAEKALRRGEIRVDTPIDIENMS